MLETRKVFDFVLTGTKKQLDEMYDLLDYERYYDKRFSKYFHVWKRYGTGVYFFPKEKYFKAKVYKDGYETSYVAALLRYGANIDVVNYEFMKIMRGRII